VVYLVNSSQLSKNPLSAKIAMATLLISLFIAIVGIAFVIPFLPIIAIDYGASGLELGVIMASFSISMAITQPIVGRLSDRHGRKRFLLTGLAIYSLTGFAYVWASSIVDMSLIRLIQGVGGGLVFAVSMAYVGDLAPEEHEGRYMGMYNIAMFGGFGCGPLIGGLLKDNFGMNTSFIAMGILGAIAFLSILLFLPESQNSNYDKKNQVGLGGAFKSILTEPRMIGIFVIRLAVMFSMVPSFIFLPVLLTTGMNASSTQIGLVITSRTLVTAALQYPFGWVADKFNKVILTVASLFGMAIVVSLIGLSVQLWHAFVLFTLLGVMEAIFQPTNSAMILEGAKKHGIGTTLGIFNTAMSIGMFIGALAAGVLIDSFGMSTGFMIVGGVVLASTIISWPLLRTPRR
jgi:DHA1 family multidrug resistance protein-like MFS transporter